MRTKSILFAALLVLPAFAGAQQKWTLDNCIKYAWENNLNVKQQEISVEQSQNNLDQSKLALTPSFSASISENMSWGRSVDLTTLEIIKHKMNVQTSAQVGGSVDLFRGFQKMNQIKISELQLKMSKEDVKKLKNDLSLEVTRAYLNVLLANEVHEVALTSRESVAKQRENTRKLVDAGSKPFSALLEIEAQLATENVQVIDAENSIRTNLLSLRQLLDLPANEEFELYIPTISDVDNYAESSVDDIYSMSLVLPQIKKAQYNLQSKKIELAKARGARYPQLSLSASASTSYSDAGEFSLDSTKAKPTFLEQLEDNISPGVGVSLSIPIFSQGQIKSGIKNAKLGLKQAELEKRTQEQNLYKEIQQAANDALSTYEQCQAKRQNVTSMQESFRYVQEKFDMGMLNGTDYTVSKTNLFKAQSDYIQAKYQHVFKLKILDFYKGVPITL